MERLPGPVGAGERAGSCLADMAHAECVDEPFERNLPSCCDRAEQVSHRHFAEAFHVLQLYFCVASFEREYVGRLLDPALLEEQLDLFLAQPIDVEGAAGDEMPEVLDPLIWAGKLASA